MGIIANIEKIYHTLNEEYADPRTKDWFLISSPFPLLILVCLYLWFCLKAGPQFMKNREAFTLRTTLKYYNLFQILFSIYLVHRGNLLWINNYSFKCQPVDYSNRPIAVSAASGTYWYFIAKLTELLDTVFFVLRKKQGQVSKLHVYHHTIMALATWTFVKYFAGGFGTLTGYVNSMVHIFMYLYYFLSALGPKYEKYLWWKRHLTIMQMVQFSFCLVVILQALPRNCAYPKSIMVFLLLQGCLFLYMFGNFYVKNYTTMGSNKVKNGRISDKNHNITKNGKHL